MAMGALTAPEALIAAKRIARWQKAARERERASKKEKERKRGARQL